jgi:hypothetical protein
MQFRWKHKFERKKLLMCQVGLHNYGDIMKTPKATESNVFIIASLHLLYLTLFVFFPGSSKTFCERQRGGSSEQKHKDSSWPQLFTGKSWVFSERASLSVNVLSILVFQEGKQTENCFLWHA